MREALSRTLILRPTGHPFLPFRNQSSKVNFVFSKIIQSSAVHSWEALERKRTLEGGLGSLVNCARKKGHPPGVPSL